MSKQTNRTGKMASIAALMTLCLMATASAMGTTEGADGPYVMLFPDGTKSAWSAHPDAEGKLIKYSENVQTGKAITVPAVGECPQFEVILREPVSRPEPAMEVWPGDELFVIADTHGEYEVCTQLLIKNGITDNALNWRFGKGRLIILGDVFDRGPNQTEMLWLLYKLEAQAAAAGGRVHLILGNHETMVLTNDIRYLHSRYFEVAAALRVASYSELWSTDTLLGRWLRSKPTVLKLGPVLFMHGGMSIASVGQKVPVEEFNDTVRAWLNDEASKNSAKVAFATGKNGPLWYRGLVQKEALPDDIAAINAFYAVERMAVGHTIVPTVTPLYNGSVIAVQVYPTKDKTTGQMNMEGVYIDEQGTWHKAKIDGTREILRDDAGNPIRNGVPTPATGSGDQPKSDAEAKPAPQKKAA